MSITSDTLTISLPAPTLAALKADAEAQGKDAAIVAADRLSEIYAPEPTVIDEGSAEEDAAIDAALIGSFHAFEAGALHKKTQRKFRSAA